MGGDDRLTSLRQKQRPFGSRGTKLMRMPEATALARLVNSRLADDDLRQAGVEARLLDGLLLRHTVMSEVRGRRAVIDGREVLNFASASYLGFDQHPAVLGASAAATQIWGQDAGYARVDTSHEVLLRLEDDLARLVGADAALVFSDLGQAHQAVLPPLLGAAGCRLLVDRGVPQSLYQAVQAAKGRGSSVAITDTSDLERVQSELAGSPAGHRVLILSSVDHSGGSEYDLAALSKICARAGAILYVDDSHGLGVNGPRGGGASDELGLGFENLILVSSLHNGLGAFGAFVAGRSEWINLLRLEAKGFLFSATLPPQVAESARVAIRLCLREEGRLRRSRLMKLSRRVRIELEAMGFQPRGRDGGPVILVPVKGELKSVLSARFLFDLNVFVNSVLAPVLPRGEAALRVSLTALHTDAEVEELLSAFGELRHYWQKFQSLLGPNVGAAREYFSRKVGFPLSAATRGSSPRRELLRPDQVK